MIMACICDVVCANANINKFNGAHLNQGFKCNSKLKHFKCPLFVLSKTEDKRCSNMHENGTDGFLEFF